MFRMGTDQRNYVKILAAVIGGSAVVAMGALAMTIHEQVAPDVAKSTNMTVGATTTTTPLSVEAIPMAKPKLKGPASLPSEERGLP